MKPIRSIPSKVWQQISNPSHRVSVYGAAPWNTEKEKNDWEIVQIGWTILFDNGTVGFGRPPFATQEAADLCIKNWT